MKTSLRKIASQWHECRQNKHNLHATHKSAQLIIDRINKINKE